MIGFGLEGQYIGVQAIEGGDSFACQTSAEPSSDNVRLFNRQGRQVGKLNFTSGSEQTKFFNNISAVFSSYNGQNVYFEITTNDYSTVNNWVVIP